MNENPQSGSASSSGDVAEELRNLAKNLKETLSTAWESEERKKLQGEIETGLADVVKTLSQAASDFKKSPAGQQLKKDAEDIHQRIRSGELETKARSELLNALRLANIELEKLRSKQKPGS